MTLVQWTPFKGWQYASPNYTRPARRCVARQNNAPSRSTSLRTPATDVYDTEDNYVLKMDVPGFAKDEIKVEFKKDTLTISGERKNDKSTEDTTYHRNERSAGNFSRSFSMPRNVDGNAINAKLKNGILELRIAKPEEQKPRTITVDFKK